MYFAPFDFYFIAGNAFTPNTDKSTHGVKWITSLRKPFIFIAHLYTFAFHYARRDPRYAITLIFDLTRLRVQARQIRFGQIYLIRYCAACDGRMGGGGIWWRERVFKNSLLGFNWWVIRRERTYIALASSRIDIMWRNAGCAGGNLQNLSHRRASPATVVR